MASAHVCLDGRRKGCSSYHLLLATYYSQEEGRCSTRYLPTPPPYLPYISRWQEEGMFDALDGLAADMLAAGLAGQGRGAEDWRRFVGGKEDL